jgi:hypothetical protein
VIHWNAGWRVRERGFDGVPVGRADGEPLPDRAEQLVMGRDGQQASPRSLFVSLYAADTAGRGLSLLPPCYRLVTGLLSACWRRREPHTPVRTPGTVRRLPCCAAHQDEPRHHGTALAAVRGRLAPHL